MEILELAQKQLFDLKVNAKTLEKEQKQIQEELLSLEQDSADFRERLTHLHIAEKILQEVVEKVSQQNLLKIEAFVNRALSLIFTDLNLSFKIGQDVKRGNNVYFFEILQDNVRGSINSFGGGIIAVIAVVLKILFNIITKRFPLLVFDETLSFLAVNYIPAMSEFLKTLSKEFNLPILLVTHQKEFAVSADNCLEISLDKEGNTIRQE